jgi:hypothetical protein
LYALAGCERCPELVMATYAELAEHGIAGSADVLPVLVGPEFSERDQLRADFITALDNAHETHPCPVTGRPYWTGCVHYDDAGRMVGVGSCHSERRADAVLAVRDVELERLRARVAELEAERRTTNGALDDAVQALREREVRLAVADGRVSFEYVDAHNHRIILNNKTTDAFNQAYVWFQAEDLAIGGAMVNVWLPVAEVARLDAALSDGAGFEFTDHTGDAIAVAPAAEDWTVFTFTRCPDGEDDEEPTTVRVVVLTARVPQLRAALNLLRVETGGA